MAAIREREASEAEQREKEALAEKLGAEQNQERSIAAKKRAEESENAREAAELQKLAEEPVTLPDARSIAEQMLRAFDDYRTGHDSGRDHERIWELIDWARCRLMTNGVEKRAQELVLAIEALIGSCDFWERLRSGTHERPMGVSSAVGSAPPDDIRVQRAEQELADVLNGNAPQRVESIGEAIAGSNVTMEQLAKSCTSWTAAASLTPPLWVRSYQRHSGVLASPRRSGGSCARPGRSISVARG